ETSQWLTLFLLLLAKVPLTRCLLYSTRTLCSGPTAQPRLRAGQGRFVGRRWWPGSFSDGPMERSQCSSTELWDLLWLGVADCFSAWSLQSEMTKLSRSMWLATPRVSTS